MEDLKKEVEDHDNRIRKLEEEVAENRRDWKTIATLTEMLSEIKDSTARTEENIKELRKDIEYDKVEIQKLKDQRNADHWEKPLSKKERLSEQITNGVAMLVIGALVGALLASIGL